MRRSAIFLSILIALSVIRGVVNAAVQANGSGHFDLAITDIEINPPDPKAGQELFVSVGYANEGPAVVTETVYISLTLTKADDPQADVGLPCLEKLESEGLQPGRDNKHTFNTCDFILPAEGNYVLTAVLMGEGTGATLLEDRVSTNNVRRSDPFHVGQFESALPDELGRLFAGLGMFAAVMAIMAVGTEVTIDTFKVFIGMKSKVTALDTLERFEKLMPGQLSALGVEAAAQEQFKKLTKDMRATLKPVDSLGQAKKMIAAGNFKEAFQELQEIKAVANRVDMLIKETNEKISRGTADINADLSDLSANVEAELTKLSDHANDALTKAEATLEKVQQGLGVNAQTAFIADLLAWFKTKLEQEGTDAVTKIKDGLATETQRVLKLQNPEAIKTEDIGLVLEKLSKIDEVVFDKLKDWSQNLTSDWLENQLGKLQNLTEDQITAVCDNVEPVLKGLGILPDNAIAQAMSSLHNQLSAINLKAAATANEYLVSLKNLLDGVESRRFDMQSPLRKIWRRLRNASIGGFILALGLGYLDAIIVWIWNKPITAVFGQEPLPALLNWLLFIGFGLLATGIEYLILLGLARLGESRYRKKLDETLAQAIRDKNQNKIAEIGRLISEKDNLTRLQYVEVLWNYIRGDEELDPHKFDKPPKVEEILKKEITATTAAQAVLARTDQQRDEESSRLRWLRAISVLVGLYLAYLLQIDAAKLLDAAVPGIGDIINRIFAFSGEQLHKAWPMFSPERAITAGIILTGLAASAGSTFWHDQLDRLQKAKQSTESAAQLLEQARQTIEQ